MQGDAPWLQRNRKGMGWSNPAKLGGFAARSQEGAVQQRERKGDVRFLRIRAGLAVRSQDGAVCEFGQTLAAREKGMGAVGRVGGMIVAASTCPPLEMPHCAMVAAQLW